jgi:multimeric flavodoxin WrbA
MVQVLVLYYSTTGNTEVLAKAVADGARTVAQVVVKRVDYATVQDLISVDAVAFGSPNYFGYMAGLMKDYFDKAWSARSLVAGKLAAAFTSGGGSSNAALLSLENMMNSFKFQKVVDGVVSSRKPSEQDLEKCRTLGKTLAEAAVERAKVTPKE